MDGGGVTETRRERDRETGTVAGTRTRATEGTWANTGTDTDPKEHEDEGTRKDRDRTTDRERSLAWDRRKPRHLKAETGTHRPRHTDTLQRTTMGPARPLHTRRPPAAR